MASGKGVNSGAGVATLGAITVCHVDERPLCRELLQTAFAARQPAARLISCAHGLEVEAALRVEPVGVLLAAYCEHSAHLKRRIAAWRVAKPRLGVILLGESPHPRYRDCAAGAGADAYLCPSDRLDDLWSAILAVPDGEAPLRAAVAVRGNASAADAACRGGLSTREFEVLLRVCRGMRLKEIADDLGIEIRTVGEYRRRLSAKLSLETPADFVSFAIESGLIPCACQAYRAPVST